MWHHRRQPARLPCPWDSPGKNTGVGCHFLFQCMKVKSESEVAQSCPTLSNPMDCSLLGSSIHGIFQARVLEWGAIALYKTILHAVFRRFADPLKTYVVQNKNYLLHITLVLWEATHCWRALWWRWWCIPLLVVKCYFNSNGCSIPIFITFFYKMPVF